MDWLFIICALLTITTSLYYRIRTTKSLKWKKEIPVVAITLSINFLGLLAALYLNRTEARKKERDYTIKLLNVSIVDINNTMRNDNVMTLFLDTNSVDSTTFQKFNQYTLINNFFNPVQLPERYLSLMDNEMILRNISYESLSVLIFANTGLKKIFHLWSNLKPTDFQYYTMYQLYKQILNINKIILEVEVRYLNKEITKNELAESCKKLQSNIDNVIHCKNNLLKNTAKSKIRNKFTTDE